MPAFRSDIDLIVDGQAVDAATANRPLQQLLDNTNYLNALLAGVAAGATLYARGAAIRSTVSVGQPVYYDAMNLRYDLAVADGTAAGQVAGVCSLKSSPTAGDVLLYGRAAVDVSAGTGGAVDPGAAYWLSPSTPGRLVKTRPSPTALVLVAGDGDTVHVTPQARDGSALVTAAGTSADANATLAALANATGLVAVGAFKNTGAHGLILREEATDAFGVSSSAERTVATATAALLQLSAAIGTALPPYVSYTVKVRSQTTGQASGYSLCLAKATP